MKEKRRKSLFNEVIGEILEYIEKNNMKSGDKFPTERELADLLQISRLTLREVLKALEALRVIEIKHGIGIFLKNIQTESSFESLLFKLFSVQGLTKKEFTDIIEVRSMIEYVTVLLAAEKITDSDIKNIESLLNTMEDNLKKGINNYEIDTLFHLAIAIASKNFVLTRIIGSIEILISSSKYAYLTDKSRALKSHKQHVNIFNALKEHNKELSANLMLDHLKNIGDEFIDSIVKKSKKDKTFIETPN